MKNLMTRVMVFSLVFALVLVSFPFLQAQTTSKAADKKIDINTASVVELQKLPRIGEKVAQRIVDFRKENGKFKKIEEIMKVKGIGEKIFGGMKDFITVGKPAKSE